MRSGSIRLQSLASQGFRPLESSQRSLVISLAFSADGKRLAAGREENGLTVWDTASGRIIADYTDHDGPVSYVDFCLDDQTLVGCDGKRSLWTRRLERQSPRRALAEFYGQIDSVCSLAGSADSRGFQAQSARVDLGPCHGYHGRVIPAQ